MRIGALQPGYLPWLGFFDQIARCDLFILFDDLPYAKNSWRNRNRIKTPRGPLWLTVPIVNEGLSRKTIREVEIREHDDWRRRHWQAIQRNYARAPCYATYAGFFEGLYSRPWRLLVDLDLAIIFHLLQVLEIRTKVILSSEEGLERAFLESRGGVTEPNERIAFLCERLGADRFLEGSLGRTFLRPPEIARRGITLELHDYGHPRYRQLFGDFVPHLSVIDLLMNHGDESLAILTGQRSVA
jgi:hypothetical protein